VVYPCPNTIDFDVTFRDGSPLPTDFPVTYSLVDS